jgi:hypothetical protein
MLWRGRIYFSIAFEEYQCFSMVYGFPVSIAPTRKEKGILKAWKL